ncbi:MAG: hypothetical protein AB1421_09045 [Pseudomonadota bacterium]
MPVPGTLFGYTEAQLAKFGLWAGLSGLVLFKLFIIRQLVRSNKLSPVAARVLYGILVVSVASILAIVLMLNYWKV